MDSEDALETDSHHVANLLNSCFSSVFNTRNLPTTVTNTSNKNKTNVNLEHALLDFVITTDEILKAPQSLRTNRSSRADEVYLILFNQRKSEILSSRTTVLYV